MVEQRAIKVATLVGKESCGEGNLQNYWMQTCWTWYRDKDKSMEESK